MVDATSTAAAPISAARALLATAGGIGLMKKHGLITADGNGFDFTQKAEVWAAFVKDVDELLVEQGVPVPENVQKIITGAAFYLPVIESLLAQVK